MISATESKPGVITLTIVTAAYGDAGEHWRRVLDKPSHGGYGRIYVERAGARARRRDACWELSGLHRGNPACNLDECPGAMFIWANADVAAHVEPLDADANQRLGRAMGAALRPFKQVTPKDLWEVEFRFL
jgi:hypothetical protein